jgi:hypothetical protein
MPTLKYHEDWMNRKWRPAMGWMYMIVCIFDFIIFPVLWSLLQAAQGGSVTTQWNPITLIGGGLFHLAMGAVLGIAAWSRGQEKLQGVSANQNTFVETPVATVRAPVTTPSYTAPRKSPVQDEQPLI